MLKQVEEVEKENMLNKNRFNAHLRSRQEERYGMSDCMWLFDYLYKTLCDKKCFGKYGDRYGLNNKEYK